MSLLTLRPIMISLYLSVKSSGGVEDFLLSSKSLDGTKTFNGVSGWNMIVKGIFPFTTKSEKFSVALKFTSDDATGFTENVADPFQTQNLLKCAVSRIYQSSVTRWWAAGKKETWYNFPSSNVVHSTGSDPCPIKATKKLVAFRSGSTGNAIGVLPLSSTGRVEDIPILNNGSNVTDLDWANEIVDEYVMLGVGAEDGTVKLCKQLAIRLWDVQHKTAAITLECTDILQTFSWKEDGQLLVSMSKDNRLSVFDPRSGTKHIKSVESHNGLRPSRVVWAGETDMIFSTGFNSRRDREYSIWDFRNLTQPLITTKIDTSPGILTPLYDSDTRMLFLTGRGDTNIKWLEIKSDDTASPVDVGALGYYGNTTFSGACLVPKLGLDIMGGKSSIDYEGLKGLSINFPNETDAFQVNVKFIALPISGPGDVSGSGLLDGTGLSDDMNQASETLSAHNGRVVLLQFHPTALNVILSYSPEQTSPLIKVWDLGTKKMISSLPLPEQALSAAFSHDGNHIAVVLRDKTIRIYESISGKEIQSGPSHQGTKAARILWIGNTGKLISVGYGRANQREIIQYDGKFLSTSMRTTTLDTSPGILIPFFDEDTGLLVLCGRGESTVSFFDIVTETDPVFLTNYSVPGGIQQISLGFLPKRLCNIRDIEILKGFRLTLGAIETISFTVPRLQKGYFQDDIFVPTRDTEHSALTADQWVAGDTANSVFIDLRPADMEPLSLAPAEKKVERKTVDLVLEQTNLSGRKQA
ncbi:hypothetical protein BASA81_004377 [Batrachochytrium salamandrivorans]|nr:hypothetical protein BASA81_004377 [Batrachochytrium salamandrivorans]